MLMAIGQIETHMILITTLKIVNAVVQSIAYGSYNIEFPNLEKF